MNAPTYWRKCMRRHTVVAALLSGVGFAALAQGQPDEPEGSRLTLTAGAEAARAGSGLYTGADLLILQQTRSQTFAFQLSGNVALVSDGDFARSIETPSASLRYRNDSGPLVFDASYAFQREAVDGLISPGELINGVSQTDFIDDDGFRTSHSASASVAIGTRDPFGANVQLSHQDISYTDTTDTDLIDRQISTAAVDLRFDVNPVLQFTPGVNYSVEDRDDIANTRVERENIRLGFISQVNKVTRVEGALSWSTVETSIDAPVGGGRAATEDESLGVDVAVTLDQRNGQTILSYNRALETTGTVDRLFYRRNMSLSAVQQLSFGAGFSRFGDSDDIGFIGSLTYAQELKNGRIRLVADQSTTVTEDDFNATTLNVSGTYSTDISARGSLSATAQYTDLRIEDPALADRTTASIALNYQHALTPEWDVGAGIRYVKTYRDDVETDNDTTLSVTLSRSISLFR